ncbi:hypothetical protein TCE0_023r07121 [Talaromyces pinophilus]|uniref:ABC transporter n=1 Tax=Talaromyces pinophilus TaxID=128442 RepID=A0A0B8N4Q2_TALPI|nr:hypothetical protein TCE0_023r07121 [Talaromyces pinophilus]
MRHRDSTPAILTAIIGLKLAMLVIESIEKRNILVPAYKDVSTESTSGLFNRALFCWLNPLLLKGYISVLSAENLFPITENISSLEVTENLQRGWQASNQRGKNAFAKVVVLSFKRPFLGTIIPRICVVALKLAQPFLIQDAIKFITNTTVASSNTTGYGLVAAYGLVYLGIAIFTGWYQHLTFRLVAMMRGALVGIIFRTMLESKIGSTPESAALTLMSTDVERIAETWSFVNEVWANLIQALIAVWLLEKQVGIVCLYPVLISLVASISSFCVGRYVARRQKSWMEATQKRVNLTTELFGSIKAVKMLGFSKILSRVVQAMRVAELDLSKGYRKLSVTNTCLTNLPNIIIPVITFAAFALSQNSLNVAQAFSSLSILSLITSPIANMIYAIPQLFSSQGCFQRIQEYLQKEPRHDLRQVITPSDRIQGDKYHGVSCTSGNLLELESLSNPARELDVGSRVDKQILSIRDGSFGWHENCQTTIQGVNLHLPGLSLTMVVGPVGCGKSTFLKGLLGETFTSKGSVQLSTREFAFCDQIPWIRNGTIRENIIGHLEFDEAWYNSVIFACALDTDFQQLPNGDSTTVGSKGMKLSGGQRQRVSMARASYARKKLAIFDDVLSGLDALTEEKVYTRLLSRNGLLRTSGTAIILATHSVNRLSLADHIIVFDPDGCISEQGTFEQLRSRERYLRARLSNTDDKSPPLAPASVMSQTALEITPVNGDTRRREGDWSVYRFYGASMGWLRLLLYGTCVLCSGTFAGLQTIWLSKWSQSGDAASRLDYWLSIYGLFALCNALALITACFIETKAPLYSHFIESLSGLATLRAFGWSDATLDKNTRLLDTSQKPFYLLLCIQRWLTLVLDMIVAVIAVLLMSLAVILRSRVNPGFLGVAMVNIMNLNTTLTNLIEFWTLLETSLGAVSRIKGFTENTKSENLAGEDRTPPPEWPLRGDLEINGISAAYDSHTRPVLSNITLSITHGQKVAICGRTGSGKSSLLLALLRMIDLTEGTIVIDGIDISTVPRDLIRSKFVTLSQDAFSLPGTVRINADPFGQASDEQIITALEQVELWKGISTKGGLDAIMDSGLFSHGQLQLFSFARAMLQDGSILILDEPTSSVDADTDELIQRLLRERFRDYTVIMIAHRLRSVVDYDKVLVLEGGKLVEFDSPAALLARASIFRSLYEAC